MRKNEIIEEKGGRKRAKEIRNDSSPRSEQSNYVGLAGGQTSSASLITSAETPTVHFAGSGKKIWLFGRLSSSVFLLSFGESGKIIKLRRVVITVSHPLLNRSK